MIWLAGREQRAFFRKAHQDWEAQFPLVTRRNRRRVVRVLRTHWDNTGTRLVGVPPSAFDDYAVQLLRCLSFNGPDEVAAMRLADIEAELGLRDSPLPHRLQVVARVKAAIA